MNLRTITSYFLVSTIWLSPLYGLKKEMADGEQPTLYYADSQTYDRELGILILRGLLKIHFKASIC